VVFIQILLGLGDSFGTPSFNAIIAEHLDVGRFIEEFSDWKLVLNIATGIGTLIGGIMVKEFGFDWLFIFMTILAIISFIGIWVQPRKLL
jgi:MFS family permease